MSVPAQHAGESHTIFGGSGDDTQGQADIHSPGGVAPHLSNVGGVHVRGAIAMGSVTPPRWFKRRARFRPGGVGFGEVSYTATAGRCRCCR